MSILIGWGGRGGWWGEGGGGGRRKVSRLPQRAPQRAGHQPQYLGVACPGPHPTWRSKVTTEARAAENRRTANAQRKRALRKANQTPPAIQLPHTHVSRVGESSGFGLASQAIFGPIAASLQSEAVPDPDVWSKNKGGGRGARAPPLDPPL